MKVDFSKYHINHCDYCEVRKESNLDIRSDICCNCIESNDYYSIPTEFHTKDQIVKKYSTLLSDFSKMLNSMGFEISK